MLIAFHYRVNFFHQTTSIIQGFDSTPFWLEENSKGKFCLDKFSGARWPLFLAVQDFFCLKVNSFRRSHESPTISLRRGILREFLRFVFRPDTLSRFDSLIGSSFSFCSCVYVIPALGFFIVFSPLLELNK